MTRQRVLGTPEEATPFIQLDEEEQQKMNANSSLLRQVLERKALLSAQLRNGDFGAAGAAVNAHVVGLTHTEELLAALRLRGSSPR